MPNTYQDQVSRMNTHTYIIPHPETKKYIAQLLFIIPQGIPEFAHDNQ